MIEQRSPYGQSMRPPENGAPVALLVEDDTLVAMVAEDFLSDLGFTVRIAVDAAAGAAAMTGDSRPAVAVIDVGLPDERGDQLARRLLQAYPALKVVIASGHDEQELRNLFAGDGQVAVLAKPYTSADLAGALKGLGLAVSEA